jgi:hypothetical protein
VGTVDLHVVALKMILSGNLASQGDIQRFFVEAEPAANLERGTSGPSRSLLWRCRRDYNL